MHLRAVRFRIRHLRFFHTILWSHILPWESGLLLSSNSQRYRLPYCLAEWWQKESFLDWECAPRGNREKEFWSVEQLPECDRPILEEKWWCWSYLSYACSSHKLASPDEYERVLPLCKPWIASSSEAARMHIIRINLFASLLQSTGVLHAPCCRPHHLELCFPECIWQIIMSELHFLILSSTILDDSAWSTDFSECRIFSIFRKRISHMCEPEEHCNAVSYDRSRGVEGTCETDKSSLCTSLIIGREWHRAQ